MVPPAVEEPCCKSPCLLPAQLAGRHSSEVVHRFHLPWVSEMTMSSTHAQGEMPTSPHNLMLSVHPVPGLSPHVGSQQLHVCPLHSPGGHSVAAPGAAAQHWLG